MTPGNALLFITLGLCCTCTYINTPRQMSYRLPRMIRPSLYKLFLKPYLSDSYGPRQFTFEGNVQIQMSTQSPGVKQIVLHSKGLNFTQPPSIAHTDYEIVSLRSDDETEQVTLELNRFLEPGTNYTVQFYFAGTLSTDMKGFYRSSYVQDGKTKWLATTQFQPTYARRVFPCFDEPAFKARFMLFILRDHYLRSSVFNTIRLYNTEMVDPAKMLEVFETTPLMSTYLVAFTVSEFQMRESHDGQFGVLARRNAFDQTVYALQVGREMLVAMNRWTNYPNMLDVHVKKMHMIALPDFHNDAMENWGLLAFRENAMLYSASESTAMDEQRIASVIMHEVSHMWFGNLVTCDWWSDLWLNEGLARYFQYFATALVMEKWQMEQQFVVDQLQLGLQYDSSIAGHPLSQEVNTTDSIEAMFDGVTYSKGASVFRMVEHLLGKDVFQMGLRKYLKDNAFKNASPWDLYRSLQFNSTASISYILRTWTEQAGYPLLTVIRTNDNVITIQQSRFCLQTRIYSDSTWDKNTWVIPITYVLSNDVKQFDNTTVRFTLFSERYWFTVPDHTDWVIFNVQQTGFYRVNYGPTMWANITMALKSENHGHIHVINRAQIVDDLLNLARSDRVKYSLAFDTLQYLQNESEYPPWVSAFKNFAYIYQRLKIDDMIEFQKWIIILTDYAYAKLTFESSESDTQLDIHNRALILGYRCKYGSANCIYKALDLFKPFMADPTKTVPANLRSVVYCTAIAHGDQAEWDFLWQRFLSTDVATEKIIILKSLGCTRKRDTLIGFLDRIFGDDIRPQDKANTLKAVLDEQPGNVQVMFEYVMQNHAKIADILGGSMLVEGLLKRIAKRFNKHEQYMQLDDFRSTIPAFASSTRVHEGIELAHVNKLWAERFVPEIMRHIRRVNAAQYKLPALFEAIATLF